MKKEFIYVALLFTETDSLCYEINEDFFDIMYQHKQIFDSSNYSKNSKYFCIDDKKVLD